MDTDDLRTERGVIVPAAAMTWTFGRSGGPGGQHVNTSSTRATLTVDVTQVRPMRLRQRVVEAIGTELRVTSQETRSQWRNRQDCLALVAARLDEAARTPPPERRPTRPTRASVERRLEAKRRSGERKSTRQATARRSSNHDSE